MYKTKKKTGMPSKREQQHGPALCKWNKERIVTGQCNQTEIYEFSLSLQVRLKGLNYWIVLNYKEHRSKP